MTKVANRKCVRRLSIRSMKAARTRNLIAIFAIALTTVLFTSLFTLAMSVNDSVQESNFRQVGGYAHGAFKYLTEKQVNELKNDPLIREYGLRRIVGMPQKEPFQKSHVEVSWCDPNEAEWLYLNPVEGHLPKEGTMEAATDTRVLKLLGVEPKLGARFTMTFMVDGKETTRTFTLSGWWEYDEAIVANHVLIPESRVEEIFNELETKGEDEMTTYWGMDVMFCNSLHIGQDMLKVLDNHGYQTEDKSKENYVSTGINWAYTGSQLAENLDPAAVLAIAAMLLLIIFTGYLIIYNVFQISVVGDIRFYGLLKTIGTTGHQIRRMIRMQALLLSFFGIPFGLILGYGLGIKLVPVILKEMDGIMAVKVSANPAIFLGAAAFALFTVLISCKRPGRIAARISPVEAVRYTQGNTKSLKKKKYRKKQSGASLFQMAWANLWRSPGRTALTILSLSLAVVLLNLTVVFTNGFDMDKYLRNAVADFVVGDSRYFQTGFGMFDNGWAVDESVIAAINAQGGIAGGGRIYGASYEGVQQFVTESYYRSILGQWNPKENVDWAVAHEEKLLDGRLAMNVQLYGMEAFALDRLKVLKGDIGKLYEPGGRYVAAVYRTDDYGNPVRDSNWANIKDTVTLRYVEEYEYYDPTTGEVLNPDKLPENQAFLTRPVKYADRDYEVAALVAVPGALSYRYYNNNQFILNGDTFVKDSGTDAVLQYSFDITEEQSPVMEEFLEDYTNQVNTKYDYESKGTYMESFESLRSMFLLVGCMLSSIVGLIGILNFLNAVLTGIITRKREFAMLQSVGMTGRQLKAVLIYEGICYAAGAVFGSFAFTVAAGPLLAEMMGSMFWFFTYHFTVVPILAVTPVFVLLGAILPMAVYRTVSRLSVVERLRENE